MPITRTTFALCALLGLCASVQPALAVECTWTGGGADNNFMTDANWSCGGVIRAPQPDEGADLLFPNGAARPTPFNSFPILSVRLIRIQGVATGNKAWTITGNGLTLTDTLRVTSPADGQGHGPSLLTPIQLGSMGTEII